MWSRSKGDAAAAFHSSLLQYVLNHDNNGGRVKLQVAELIYHRMHAVTAETCVTTFQQHVQQQYSM
jgi:hypothetical protein